MKSNELVKEKQKHNILLLIDDEEDILYTFHSLLKRKDISYILIQILSSLETWQKKKKNSHNYDLVVMDIRMREVSGIRLFYRFKG
ncbi:MAG: response regulator [Candidatus Nitrosocosmicus sp.]|nr:response regulator [Candidatus Nitrosocosmicus sp.]